ncbi:SDR family NAD(P)-dependent oxidoreductase [Brenneria nigrifluens DSM 30175 = ATCC 13028]|uniref:SDR family NAD(P)-dependent oxidoreductase n=1 Tax=Brenneria nigrifluens DSM 30175 = ATCC 13028 TaxID=1121120 RepID=A0A2U1UIE1_9GAMM|nr:MULTISPECIES: SDR family NAD(P)-dependent oxidoreductase [Brenneria]EHD21239.1 short-chain dehydrogenase/reductase SDR [Brenneria sp. EniD312]PWC21439.1 hypothetical protein DDT54_19065 [Brenneria nigrifluens DSM 30175 = ATCC 13028]QCR04379.1 SDR family NAD(P)-dependent oxidoreductase [Brenneria nigrifluens DSM 30175 = ATCC 13028]
MTAQKTLLLTGASRGIGHATVKHFHAAGWRIFTASRQNWAEECPWAEKLLNHIHLDLEDIDSLQQALPLIKEKLGGWMRWSITREFRLNSIAGSRVHPFAGASYVNGAEIHVNGGQHV